MKKCVRTLENWCRDGDMPQPAMLGSSRYWHPDVFYGWLDAVLKGLSWEPRLPSEVRPDTVVAFQPLTSEDAARILQKTKRTLENWCDDGIMPRPVLIGGTRYWHPAIFNDWLDTRLKGQAWQPLAPAADDASSQAAAPGQAPEVTATAAAAVASKPSERPRRRKPEGATAAARGRARNAALLKAMNSFSPGE